MDPSVPTAVPQLHDSSGRQVSPSRPGIRGARRTACIVAAVAVFIYVGFYFLVWNAR